MYVILFRSSLTEHAGEEFEQAGDRMLELAKSMPGSGYVDMRSYTAPDGERLSVVWWRDRESLDAWRKDLRHRHVKRLGRERWYSFFDIEVAEVIASSHYDSAASYGRSAVESVTIAAEVDEVLAFLADLSNLPRWVPQHPDVQVSVEPSADRVDFVLLPPSGQETRVSARVEPGDHGAHVSVTKRQLPGESDEKFTRRVANLRAELVNLRELWTIPPG